MDIDPGVVRQILLGVVPPGAAATAVFALLWWRKPDRSAPRGTSLWRQVATPLAMVALYVGFHALLFGSPRFPPKSSMDWLPLAAAAAGVCAIAFGLVHPARAGRERRRTGQIARWAVTLLLGIAALSLVGYLAAGNATRLWSASEAAMNIAPFVLASAVAAFCLEFVAHRRRGLAGLLVVLVFAAGASQVLVLAFSSLKLSQSAGLWAAFAGGAFLVALFRRRLSIAGGGAALVAVMTVVALFQGVHFTYASRPWLYISLVVASAGLAAVASVPAPTTRRGVTGFLMSGVPAAAALLPVTIAVALALSQQTESDY